MILAVISQHHQTRVNRGGPAICLLCQVEEFPLLMPGARPQQAESYLCTPVRLDTEASYSLVGFRPNASKQTAHHMLIYGCEEPGQCHCSAEIISRLQHCSTAAAPRDNSIALTFDDDTATLASSGHTAVHGQL